MLLFNTSKSLGKEPSSSPIAAYGEATASCGSFVESKQNENQRYIYLAWLNGYLTAVNKYHGDVKSYNGLRDIKAGRDRQALLLWLENYCRENPLDNFARAVFMLQHELQK
jgi:hypothetical protein